jgi:ankyrin repeat protein
VLPESSRELNRGLEMGSKRQIIDPPVQFAFPPLHRILRSGCISSAPPLIFGMEFFPDITHSPPLHTAITENNPAAYIMIQKGNEDQLESRDRYSRTPMLLTALFMAENIGVALMTRYMACPIEARRRLVDARENMGQTILAIAIRQGCTFEFIKALVENCANVDPDPIEFILSPLQAAASQGRKDVTSLLLSYGARDSNTFYGEVPASTLAHNHGYLDIEALIIAETPS